MPNETAPDQPLIYGVPAQRLAAQRETVRVFLQEQRIGVGGRIQNPEHDADYNQAVGLLASIEHLLQVVNVWPGTER